MARTVLPVRAEAPERLGRMVRMEPLGPLDLRVLLVRTVAMGLPGLADHPGRVALPELQVQAEHQERMVPMEHRGFPDLLEPLVRQEVMGLPEHLDRAEQLVRLGLRERPVLLEATEPLEVPEPPDQRVPMEPRVLPEVRDHPAPTVPPEPRDRVDRRVVAEPMAHREALVLLEPMVVTEPADRLVRAVLRDLTVRRDLPEHLGRPEATGHLEVAVAPVRLALTEPRGLVEPPGPAGHREVLEHMERVVRRGVLGRTVPMVPLVQADLLAVPELMGVTEHRGRPDRLVQAAHQAPMGPMELPALAAAVVRPGRVFIGKVPGKNPYRTMSMMS